MSRMRYGVHRPLEDEADAIIALSLAGVTSQSAKSDILTPWKENQRRKREVYTATGVPDAAIRQGMYHRRANPARPHLNSRDGIAPPQLDDRQSRQSQQMRSSLADFLVDRMQSQA